VTEYQRLFAELAALNAEIRGIAGNTRRAPLIDRANGLKAQLKAWTAYKCAGYRYGSTNGQRPQAHCIVLTKGTDKRAIVAAAARQMGTYKALAFRLKPLTDLAATSAETERLYGHGLPIIEA
jgi:hypothetical protein